MIDYSNPDYTDIFIARAEKLAALTADNKLLAAHVLHYRENPWDFIIDWGFTFDPRMVELGKLPNIPFILFPRQVEFLKWLQDRWLERERGLVEKSRDMGITWLCVAFCVSMWLFRDGFSAGFGSRKEMLVDKMGDPDCIFEKIRHFVRHVPEIFMPVGYEERIHSGKLKLINPDNGASITGEAGDDIGRGGRKSIYLVDEAAFIEHQQSVDNALSNTTNCQIDISTYNGNGNIFYQKSMRFHGTHRKFIFDWHDDPRKSEVWYAKQLEEKDPVTVAQEIDRDPDASAENVFIPAQWVRAAVDLHKVIKVPPSGVRATAFDPADVGDAKATASRHGYIVTQAKQKKDGDITDAVPWAYEVAFDQRSDVLVYDADGMGAPTMKLAFKTYSAGRTQILPFYGSGSVREKKMKYGEKAGLSYLEKDRTLRSNEDTFQNFRAQAATLLRDRFYNSFKVRQQVEKGGVALQVDVDELISIDSECENFHELRAELSRPQREWTPSGKIKVESKIHMRGRGVQSPNLFDCLMMLFSMQASQMEAPTVRVKGFAVRDRGLGW